MVPPLVSQVPLPQVHVPHANPAPAAAAILVPTPQVHRVLDNPIVNPRPVDDYHIPRVQSVSSLNYSRYGDSESHPGMLTPDDLARLDSSGCLMSEICWRMFPTWNPH